MSIICKDPCDDTDGVKFSISRFIIRPFSPVPVTWDKLTPFSSAPSILCAALKSKSALFKLFAFYSTTNLSVLATSPSGDKF